LESVVVRADANARLGATLSPAVGPVGAEAENHGGTCFHGFVLGQQLVLLCTFEGTQRGLQTKTWTAPAGAMVARIDYIAVDSDLAARVWETEVLADLPVACGATVDHFVSVARLTIGGVKPAVGGTSWYCRRGLRLPEVQEQLKS
jgi:hypothetical protein